MKLFGKISAGALCAAMLLSMCACSEEDGPSAGGNTPQSSGTTTAMTTTTEDDELVNPVDVSGISTTINFDTVELEDPMLTYLGIYDLTKAGDIKPSMKFYEKTYAQKYYDAASDTYIYPNGAEKVIIYDQTTWAALLDVLAARIASDESPDLVDKQDNTYPYWMSKNMYEDLTPYMDMSAPQWEKLQPYIDRYEYNGKHFYYPWSYSVSPEFMYYNRTLFDEYNIPDPAEQWAAGEWTWDTFLNAVNTFVDKSDNDRTLGVYGSFLTDNFIASTGQMLIGIDENGKFVNNMKNADVERAVGFLESNIRRTGLGMIDYYAEYNNVSPQPIIQGLAAFQTMGGWMFDEYTQRYGDHDIFLVPFPRDPQADDYYYRTSTFGYLVPKGAKNVEGACCFINCCRLSVTDPELAAATKESIMRGKRRSEEEYDFMFQFALVENFSTVLDENYCFDDDTSNMLQSMLINAGMDQSDSQMSWAQSVETNSPIIDNAIADFNALIA